MKIALTVFLSISALCAVMGIGQTFSCFHDLALASSAGQVVPHERVEPYEAIAQAEPHGASAE